MTDDEKRLINRKKIKEIILKNLPKGRYININYRAKLLSVKDSVLINKIIIKNKIKIDGKNEIFKLKHTALSQKYPDCAVLLTHFIIFLPCAL